ncbi:MAG: DUF302 domain-containing protein [Proteobacteria bacterium]|nr:DUF302 domain-containing protein [Pseudomonadota bacterium]
MYSFSIQVTGDLAAIEEKIVAALADEGFGVLTEIDVQAVLKKKLGLDKRPYKILGACNPHLANQAIEAEPEIGVLLPCNVILRQDDNENNIVTFMDPEAVLTLVDREDIAILAKEVRARMQRVSDAVEAAFGSGN